jgi:hypothetical protein
MPKETKLYDCLEVSPSCTEVCIRNNRSDGNLSLSLPLKCTESLVLPPLDSSLFHLFVQTPCLAPFIAHIYLILLNYCSFCPNLPSKLIIRLLFFQNLGPFLFFLMSYHSYQETHTSYLNLP